MRNVLALVALTAACGDDSNNKTPDAAVVLVDAEVIPDAAPTVEGMWRDTYHTTSGPMVATSSCAMAPTALKVDPTSATVTTYPGTCKPDGTFKIDAPGNLGTYYLRAGGVLYETNRRAGIDLSTDRLGRPDIAGITGVTLDLTMTNLQAWTDADLIVAFGANIGYRQNLNFTSGTPTATDTTLTASANWNGYKIEGAKSDALQILQLGKHTTGTYDYVSLDRIYGAPSFTMVNNTAQAVAGAFTTATAGSVDLAVNVASFNQFAAAVAPGVSSKTVQGSTYAAVSTDAIDSPPLISFAQDSDGLTTMSFGTLSYTDPFPSSWTRMVKVQVGFTVPYSYNGANGTLTATVLRVLPKTLASTGTVAAYVGPPTQVQFEGTNALTATTITTVPMLSWSAPSVGNATDYEIQVYEVKPVATALTFTSVLRIVTKATSLRLPSGYLLGQRQYVISVRARNREGVDVYTTPLHNGASWSSAETLSALVTTN